MIGRQRPGTASGVTFFTLEDETGIVNLIVQRKVFAENYAVARHAQLLMVKGRLEREGEVIHVLAEELSRLALPEGEELPVRSTGFSLRAGPHAAADDCPARESAVRSGAWRVPRRSTKRTSSSTRGRSTSSGKGNRPHAIKPQSDPSFYIEPPAQKKGKVSLPSPVETIRQRLLTGTHDTKMFLCGHVGSGKSTELNRLKAHEEIQKEFSVVLLSFEDQEWATLTRRRSCSGSRVRSARASSSTCWPRTPPSSTRRFGS